MIDHFHKSLSLKDSEDFAQDPFANFRSIRRESLQSVLRQRQEQQDSCLSLPFTLAFFVLYVLMVWRHEQIPTVHGVEFGIRSLFEEYSFDDDNSKTLYDVAEVKDVWRFLKEAFLDTLFQQTDHLGASLPRSEWSRILGSNYLVNGVLLEQTRGKAADCPVFSQEALKASFPASWECHPASERARLPFGPQNSTAVACRVLDRVAGLSSAGGFCTGQGAPFSSIYLSGSDFHPGASGVPR